MQLGSTWYVVDIAIPLTISIANDTALIFVVDLVFDVVETNFNIVFIDLIII